MAGEADGLNFEIESGVSLFTKLPFVALRVGNEAQQMAPEKARELGRWFFESAVEAERDAALVKGLVGDGMELEEAAQILQLVRRHRPKED